MTTDDPEFPKNLSIWIVDGRNFIKFVSVPKISSKSAIGGSACVFVVKNTNPVGYLSHLLYLPPYRLNCPTFSNKTTKRLKARF